MELCLIDGYGFVFRAYHSLPPLTRADGTPIGCVYGFCNMLSKFLANHTVDYIAVVLDSGKKNFRHTLFDQYKANRPAPPQELVVQFPMIRDAINAFNVPLLEVEGYEADDIIAVYTKNAVALGMSVKIVSSDKDLMQLVSEKVKLYDPIKNIEIGPIEVKAKFGVGPSQVSDYLSLVGDSSDNVPGAKGVGPKCATDLLSQFSSVSEIYSNIGSIPKERTRKLLLDSRHNVELSMKLVNLGRDYDIECDIDELRRPEADTARLFQYLHEQGFKSLLARLSKEKGVVFAVPDVVKKDDISFAQLPNLKALEQYIDAILEEGKVAIHISDDTFYFSYNIHHFKIQFHSVAGQGSLQFGGNELSLSAILSAFAPLFEDSSVLKILVDSKALYKKLDSMSILLNAFDDIAEIAYCLETGKHSCAFEDLLNEYAPDRVGKQDSASIMAIYDRLQPLLFRERKFYLYEMITKPMIPLLARMEIKGMKVDSGMLKVLSQEFKQNLNLIEKSIYDEVGHEFSIGSPKQLGEILFVELGIAGGKKSPKSGTFATGADVLEKLAEQGYTIAEKVLRWRQFAKLINTYTDALTNAINPATGRIHTTFMTTITNTGRLSSRDPNLQNIPIRSDEGQKVRQAFAAESGYMLLSADYSQIELRLLAHVAKIPELMNAFRNKQDIHVITASEMFGVEHTAVTPYMRRQAKMINFGIIYGISAFGLAERLGISRQVAKEYIEKYFNRYPGIKKYMDETVEYARIHGFVCNIFGRKCYINGINDRNAIVRNFSERAAINAPLQSANADIIKKAMVQLPTELKECVILQIHDELLFEVPQGKVEEYSKVIKRLMEGAVQLSVPLDVEIRASLHWGEQ